MPVRATFLTCFVFCLSLALVASPCPPVQAGLLFSVAGKVAAKKAAQRTALQAAERRAIVNAERAAVRDVGLKTEKSAFAEAKSKAQWANRQAREGKINSAEKSQFIYALDKRRDNFLTVKPLTKERTVYRYHPSVKQAQQEKRYGIAPGSHLTASGPGQVGRPINSATAQSRYGLAQRPVARTTVTLPAKIPVRQGKALGGKAGYGEIIPARNVRPESIGELKIYP